jgi:hypothetical protein
MSLAEYAELRADHKAAFALLTEGRDTGAELGDWADLWYFDGMLAAVRARMGDIGAARDQVARVAQRMVALGTAWGDDASTWLGIVAAEVACRAGDFPEAQRCCTNVLAAVATKPTIWWHPYKVAATIRLAMVALAQGDDALCRDLLAAALRLAGDWYEHPPLAAVLDALAVYVLHVDGGNAAIAAKLLGASHTIRGAFDESSLDAPVARRAAKDLLGETAFETAYASGRALSRDAATALARDQR